jgi:trimeric autotransporter adhesin
MTLPNGSRIKAARFSPLKFFAFSGSATTRNNERGQTERKNHMNPLILRLKKLTPLYLTAFALGCLALSPKAQAVEPAAPDTALAGGNTADGQGALLSLTTGTYNTAVGLYSLLSLTDGNFNTGIGAGTLLSSTADENTATGAGALFSNTTGGTNTANGTFALFSNTTGGSNTAVGASALQSNTTGIFNTANGATTLFNNTTGNNNTGVGLGALLNNTTNSFNTGVGTTALAGNSADGNTGVGAAALFTPNTGAGNTAVGAQALFSNTGDAMDPPDGRLNTAVGLAALFSNTTGNGNTAIGAGGPPPTPTPAARDNRALLSVRPFGQQSAGPAALASNTTGDSNTAVGGAPGIAAAALGSNTTGVFNTAVGAATLTSNGALGGNTTGSANTAIGTNALQTNTTGSSNIAVGRNAGQSLTTGDNNIDIGNDGVPDEANTIRIGTSGTQTATFIAGISGTAVVGDPVVVDANGQLGTAISSARFKKDITPMEKTSEAILGLKPVSFHYKSDSKGTPQFGLIAEEVAQVNPDLVVHDRNGQIYSVRYEAVNAMLLNEFLKEHRTVQEQQKEIDALNAELKEQRTLIQKVNDKVEFGKPAAQTVTNNH